MTLADRISSLETRKAALESSLARPDPMAAHFPLGVGSASATAQRRQGVAVDRLAQQSAELLRVTSELSHLRARQSSVNAGECHENGQPCASAPSRQKAHSLAELYGSFLRATVAPGGQVELVCNGSIHEVKSIGKRKVRLVGGDDDDPWDFFDVRPLNGDGSKMSTAELKAALAAWRTGAQSTPVAVTA